MSSIQEITKIEELEELYDLTPEPDEVELPPLNEGLSKGEIAEAPFYNQLKTGVMIVVGAIGSGKNTFMHFLLWKLRTLFKGVTVLLDKKPRPLFGKYIPITIETVIDEFKNLDEKYRTGKRDIKRDFAKYSQNKDRINDLIEKWIADKGDIFHNAAMGFDEFWIDFNNREPHNMMNKVLHPLVKRQRHHNSLILGAAPYEDELDIKRCLRYVTHKVECSQTLTPGLHKYVINRYRHYTSGRVLEVAQRPIILYINAFEPRARLGGKCVYDLFNSWERGEVTPRVRIKA